jgi:anti-anti-sigma factor
MTSKDNNRAQWRLTVDTTADDGIVVIAVAGRIGHLSAGRLEQAFDQALAQGARRVALDLGGVDYISSAGLVVLDTLARRLDGVDGRLTLCALAEPAMLVLQLAGWSDRFAIEPSRADAIRRLST